ncbi:hypothetical protein PAMP_007526 [Pampus punctatissimus]
MERRATGRRDVLGGLIWEHQAAVTGSGMSGGERGNNVGPTAASVGRRGCNYAMGNGDSDILLWAQNFSLFFQSVPGLSQKKKNVLEEQQTYTSTCLAVNKLCWHGLGKTTTHEPCGEVCVAWRVQIQGDVCSLFASPVERWGGRRTRRFLVNVNCDSRGHEAAVNPGAARGLSYSKTRGREDQGVSLCMCHVNADHAVYGRFTRLFLPSWVPDLTYLL